MTAVNSLAVLFKYSGRFDDAAALYERALAAAERTGASDESLATLLHNIAGLEHARGDYARGEPAARRSVELRERALGPDHPAVAADVAALAAIVDGLGRHDEAEALYLRALGTFERVYGPDHYEIAVNLNNLAGVRQAQGRLAEAEELYRRALAIKEALLGGEHPDVALTLNNLALLLDARVGEPKPNRSTSARFRFCTTGSIRGIPRFSRVRRTMLGCCGTSVVRRTPAPSRGGTGSRLRALGSRLSAFGFRLSALGKIFEYMVEGFTRA